MKRVIAVVVAGWAALLFATSAFAEVTLNSARLGAVDTVALANINTPAELAACQHYRPQDRRPAWLSGPI